MTIALRPAEEADLSAINGIYNHFIRCSTCTYHVDPVSVEERRTWFAQHSAREGGGRFPVIVACDAAGHVIGWASLSPFRSSFGYRFTVENSVYVHPDHHRRGIGRALLADLVARSDGLGHREIVAVISSDQAASIALHRKMGFAKTGLLRGVGNKFDRWLDVLFMQRSRPQPSPAPSSEQ